MTDLDNAVGDAPAPSAPSAHSDKLDRRVLVVAGVVVLGAIMSILDITVVSVAIPTWEETFNADTTAVAWTMTAYTLALAMVIPLTGWAADRFGPKRLYLIAVLLFTIGSVLCALAPSLTWLIVFRVLQGLGGGMLMPLGMTILTKAAGPHRVGRVMAVMGIPMLLGPIFGPILGGWMIDNLSWHWIFLINLPIGIAALVYTWFALEPDDVNPSESLDLIGLLLLSPGLALFLYGVSTIPSAKMSEGTAWTTEVVGTMVAGLLLVIGFCFWVMRKNAVHPLLDLRLFKNRNLTVAVIAMTFFGIAFMGASLLFPKFFQDIQAFTPTGSGGMLAPQGIGAMLTMPLAGFLVDRIGPGKVVLAGATVVTLGMGLFTQVGPETGKPYVMLALFVMGLGMGATMMPIMTAALATLVAHTVARGSTLMNIVSQVANACGAAIFSVLLVNNISSSREAAATSALKTAGDAAQDPNVQAGILTKLGLDPATFDSVAGLDALSGAFTDTFVIATVLLALVLVPAFFLPRKKMETSADPTMMVGH